MSRSPWALAAASLLTLAIGDGPARAGAVAAAPDLQTIGLYSQPDEAEAQQVSSVETFTDVRPTDWAYQALSTLISRYGCVAGFPDGTFQGGRPLSRYEAAALLNACLDRVSAVTPTPALALARRRPPRSSVSMRRAGRGRRCRRAITWTAITTAIGSPPCARL
ncbi:MAG: S-layer homology domain-containing protein, partial [Synechococcaceae cyanobacterium]|nr:S-layer homology domain-containing protein [Synechococcaceae cyanobacterium]